MARYKNSGSLKSNGVVYTPAEMADYLANEMIKYHSVSDAKELNILDPAIGSGELIIALLKMLSINSPMTKIHVIGYETDKTVSSDTTKKLHKLFPAAEIDVINGDFLDESEKISRNFFDYIIANPPYIRTQILGAEKAQQISKKYGLNGRVDIYYAFLIIVKSMLKKDGIAGYITSNKFMTIKAGGAVRKFIENNYKLFEVVDFGDTKLFDAAVLPCIMVFGNGNTNCDSHTSFISMYEVDKSTKSEMKIASIFEAIGRTGVFELDDSRKIEFKKGTLKIGDDDIWTNELKESFDWLTTVDKNTWKIFDDIGHIRVGIKTTADNVFIGEKLDRKIELLKPLITHRNAGQIIPNKEKMWQVLYTHEMINGKCSAVKLDDYPNAKRYLEKFYKQLNGRKYLEKANRNWYEIWVPQNLSAFSNRKIVFRDISEHPQFWLDESGSIVNGDCYWIEINRAESENTVYLALAVANSTFIEKYYDLKFNTKLYSGKRRYQTQYVKKFPIPYPNSDEAKKIISLVKKCLKENDVGKYKAEIDDLMYVAFGLINNSKNH